MIFIMDEENSSISPLTPNPQSISSIQPLLPSQLTPTTTQPSLPTNILHILESQQEQIHQLQQQISHLMIAILNNEYRTINCSVSFDEEKIFPPQFGNQTPSNEFPRTVLQLKQCSPELLSQLEDYYELSHDGSLLQRKYRMSKIYNLSSSITLE